MGILILLPILILYKLKLIPNYRAKQLVFSFFFKGLDSQNFESLSKEFSLSQIDKIVRPQAMRKIAWHKKEGHKIVVVSASIESYLKPWCNKNELDLIATKIELKNGLVNGKFHTKNCYGEEKEIRLKELYNLNDYDCIYAYGDSRGDKELLALAHIKKYRTF